MLGCDIASRYSIQELSFPTPLGQVVLKLDTNRKVASLSEEKLGKTPLGVSTKTLEPGEYHPNKELRYAVWVPNECGHEAGRAFALDPGYTKEMQMAYEKNVKDMRLLYGEPPPAVRLSDLYLQSESSRFSCGGHTTIRVNKGSILGGWTINDAKLAEIKSSGGSEVSYPRREIRVTAINKSKWIPTGFSASAGNLLLWTNEFRLSIWDVERLYSGKETNQIYELFRTTHENIEIDGKPRTVRFQGICGIFEGSTYLYIVTVVAQIGPTTETQWLSLQAVIESFRFE